MDCYLCGASNPPDADFCSRCDGQLLKIGLDAEFDEQPDEPIIPDTASGEADSAAEQDAPKPTKKLRQSRLKSVEDSRLEDALGLGGPREELDDEATELVIPKAGPSVGIPMIGTRSPSVVSGGVSENRGRGAYVLLGMLTVAVVWMAYSTLFANDDDGLPDNLALTNTTLPPDTTPTTAPRPRPWSSAEVGGKFGPTFVRVTLIDCPIDKTEGVATQPLEEWIAFGVTVNEHSVIFPGSDIRTADVATIRSRFGNTAPSRISRLPNGIGVVTTDRSLNRTLDLVDEPMGEAVYYVSYDDEFATTTVTTERSDVALEVTVTDQGEAIAVRLEDAVADLDLLGEVSTYRTEVQPNPAPLRGGTICDDAPYIVDSTPDPNQELEEEE